ncbi:LytR C-terminal domain-containing protein [Hydrogenophaga sp. PBL-H3]|uniref:LytR C-terminal domain-containing protein n=1 Tax=Hydrogenophaga sp. PBL-H3 TaxID=434010 RepID=UPI0013201B16|nr:LytR C-terminal domain-containing protein [Hydrogenophaga sp. PBL-H3]QHE76515.1 tetratricopeptide repeat protein [Hydrogenophaga sp. PBL-H3]QHE80939.1 tetratricopeptide repeat protein [Hydrogenophaga sp. PBL-H3]
MKTSVFASTLLLGSLVGCATPTSAPHATAAQVPVTVMPAPAITPDMPASEVAYAMARQAHGQGQLRLAAEHYTRTLAADGRHVGALNGLGVIRAQEGFTAEALALFARSRDLSPLSAHVHNNLGYTLLQSDRLTEARLALRLAMDLDPGSLQTLQNLRLLSEAERRAQTAAAEMVREQPVVNASGEAAGALVVVAPQIYELRATTTLTATAPAIAAATVPATDLRRLRLEVTNGAGIERLARRTASQLAKSGVRVARLTNASPYRQVRTQIRYVAGQEAALQALVQHLPVAVERVAVPSLPAGMQLKLVLGRDFTGQAIAAWIHQQDAEQVTTRPQAVAPLS